jgi:hypothetical protein
MPGKRSKLYTEAIDGESADKALDRVAIRKRRNATPRK